MLLQTLRCTDFRNIASVELNLSPGLNLIVGDNAMGKTSVLESIYFLSYGRSFRSTKSAHLVAHTKDAFSIYANFMNNNEKEMSVGVQKLTQGKTLIKLNKEKVHSISEIAKLLPMKLIPSDAHVLLTLGPKVRRAYLDWGLFHVKHDFHELWSQYSKALASRNALLKHKIQNSELDYWSELLLTTGLQLDGLRRSYIKDIEGLFDAFNLSGNDIKQDISFKYFPGWQNDMDFAEAIKQSLYRDLAVGHTMVGPHRADLLLTYRGGAGERYIIARAAKIIVL